MKWRKKIISENQFLAIRCIQLGVSGIHAPPVTKNRMWSTPRSLVDVILNLTVKSF